MADWQFSYNGWTFGDGTSYGVVEASGFGLADIRSNNVDLPNGHGSFPGLDFYSERSVRFRLEMTADSDAAFESAMDTMRRATAVQSTDLPLVIDLPGQTVKRLECRPLRRRAPIDHAYSMRYAVIDLEFLAADPLFYENTATDTVITTATAVTNSGDTAAKWTAAITGATNPTLTHNGSGLALTFTDDGGLSGAVDIVSSARARTAVQSSTNVYGKLTALSEFFLLDVGANSLTYTGGGTCTVTHRHAYAALT